MYQGAPYIAAVLAYAIGNQTIAQRLFAVREDLIKPTFITATIGYGAMVIGVGMLGVLALYLGMEPMNGDTNNIIPQMAAEYLPTVLVGLFLIVIIGALSSTADSDLSALSSIVMTDIYGQNVARRGKASPKMMLYVGRVTMILATTAAVVLAGMQMDILDMLVFVGALWGALVFPVIASFYWQKVTNAAFVTGVLAALAVFIPVRFGLFPLEYAILSVPVDVLAAVGVGVILGLMAFGFFGLRAGKITGVAAALITLPFALGSLHDYTVLSASLVAYAVSTLIVLVMCFRNNVVFDFSTVQERVGNFDKDASGPETDGGAPISAARKEG